jgi:HlyD family secretion protein
MDPLEGTSLDLIYRRRVNTFFPGYTIILMVVGMIVALPLVKVDVVSTSNGRITTLREPADLLAPISGIVDSCLLNNQRIVSSGDTLVWIGRGIPESRIRELLERVRLNEASISDITSILAEREPSESSRYIQSLRNHLTGQQQLAIHRELLKDEFQTSEILYQQEVIPKREYEQARSVYLACCIEMEEHRQNYRNLLESDLLRLLTENRSLRSEIDQTETSLENYFVTAPLSGILGNVHGIGKGSVLQPGTGLGTIFPEEGLVAECYLESKHIAAIRTGMLVRIRFDANRQQRGSWIETRVSRIEQPAILLNGTTVYRITCILEDSQFIEGTGHTMPIKPGMTFSACLVLYRASLSSLIFERLERFTDPRLSQAIALPAYEKEI